MAIRERIGTTLRYLLAVETIARRSMQQAGHPSWSALWQRALDEFLAARGAVAQRAVNLLRCRNPFGISDDDLPLFFGDTAGSSGRFFASSDYLLSLATPALATANGALTDARLAWERGRTSQIQQLVSHTEFTRRSEELSRRYGAAIVQACGLSNLDAKDAIDLFDAGRPDALAPETCHLDRVPACRAASQDVALARKSWEDAQTAYDLQAQYCLTLAKGLQHQRDGQGDHDRLPGLRSAGRP